MDRDAIAHANRAAGENLGPQSAAMDQSLLDALLRKFLEVAARFAEFDAADAHIANGEFSIHKMIESDAARKQVAPRLRRLERDAVFSLQCRECFALDERHFTIGRAFL